MPLRVEVTADDIAEATRGAGGCPVARATRRAAGAEYVVAGVHWIDVRGTDGYLLSHPTPPAVAAFMRRFDRGETVAPMAFDLAD